VTHDLLGVAYWHWGPAATTHILRRIISLVQDSDYAIGVAYVHDHPGTLG
jgi:hypothetical protein